MHFYGLLLITICFSAHSQSVKCDGYNKLYNENREIWQDGEFKNCKLWNGKHYIYNNDGILTCIHVYKDGAYHSNGLQGNLGSCSPPGKGPCEDGYHKFCTADNQPIMVGEFKNCQLYNGKLYKYDTDGLLEKIEVYKNGRYLADGVLGTDEQRTGDCETYTGIGKPRIPKPIYREPPLPRPGRTKPDKGGKHVPGLDADTARVLIPGDTIEGFAQILDNGRVYEEGTFVVRDGRPVLDSGNRYIYNNIAQKIGDEKVLNSQVLESHVESFEEMSLDSIKIKTVFSPFNGETMTQESIQSYGLLGTDTVNRQLVNKHRNGHWLRYAEAPKDIGYGVGDFVEMGTYINNRKQGLFIKFHPGNRQKLIAYFKNARPNGAYLKFFENGELREHGTWFGRKQTGYLVRYYDNGVKQCELLSDRYGKKKRAAYYHPNGQLELFVLYDTDGKEKYMWRFYPNGNLKEKKSYSDGLVDGYSKFDR